MEISGGYEAPECSNAFIKSVAFITMLVASVAFYF
jgi:hypothetical protein